MKAFIAVSALAAVASASMQVHMYTDSACANELPLQRNALQGVADCVAIQSPFVSVPELDKKFEFVRQSHIDNEVLLFEDFASCTKYPAAFDRNQQVAFIRSAEEGVCTPCDRCGNVNSVKFTTMADVSAASSTVPAVVSALVLAGLSTLLL